MEMLRLDIKKNILMKKEGSHVGDVLIKMSEWPGHCCTPTTQLQCSYKQGLPALWVGGWPPSSFPSLEEDHEGGACR